ncbi:hypothetical protein DFJ73DRAFT_761509 [Zopfochytrium polystomum]|nr:hypothetical protein DFJ73DRAFT_761509 [Zopfochytrium polystomum]
MQTARRSSLSEARSGSGGVDEAQVLNNEKSDGSQMGETEMLWQETTKVGSTIGHTISSGRRSSSVRWLGFWGCGGGTRKLDHVASEVIAKALANGNDVVSKRHSHRVSQFRQISGQLDQSSKSIVPPCFRLLHQPKVELFRVVAYQQQRQKNKHLVQTVNQATMWVVQADVARFNKEIEGSCMEILVEQKTTTTSLFATLSQPMAVISTSHFAAITAFSRDLDLDISAALPVPSTLAVKLFPIDLLAVSI